MKKTLLIIALFISARSYSQSNEFGTMHIDFGWAGIIHGSDAEFTSTFPGFPTITTTPGSGRNTHLYLKTQFGLLKFLSAGVYFRFKEKSKNLVHMPDEIPKIAFPIYASGQLLTGPDFVSFARIPIMSKSFGVESRINLVNSDLVTFYLSPFAGYTRGESSYHFFGGYDGHVINVTGSDGTEDLEKINGFHYGINAGGNYFLSEFVGLGMEMGYAAASFKSSMNPVYNYEYTVKNKGFYLAISVVSKFNVIK